MANTFNNMKDAPGVIAKAAAKMFVDEMHFCSSIDKAPEEDYKGKNGYSAGDTILINKPPRYIPGEDFDITSSIQDITEEKTSLTLDISSTIGVEIGTLESATEIQVKEIIRRIIKPAVSSIAHNVESRFLQKATQATFNAVGTPGSNVFDVDTVLSAREKMNKFLCPQDDERNFLLDSSAGRSAVNARKGLFQSSDEISKQYKKGYIGVSDGFKWMESELLYNHTNGNDVTGVTIKTTVATSGASSVVFTGLTTTTGTVKKGQVFTIADVYAVHPITKTVYPFLQQFVVTADATADASGDATVSISPSLNSTANGIQNIDALPQATAALVFYGAASTAYSQSLTFHKEAFRMVSVPLVMPTNAEFAAQETYKGITVAIVRDWDQLKRRMITRLDFLGGLASVRPEWACRISS